MSQQAINFADKIKITIFNNWDLKDELLRTKIFWASYKVKPNIIEDQPYAITIEEISGLGTPQSLKHTKFDTLFKIDFWVKIKPDESDENRIKAENTRALMKDKIMKIIHDNQTAITGIKIATFGRMQTLDEVEESPTHLHNTIFISGQWWHIKG